MVLISTIQKMRSGKVVSSFKSKLVTNPLKKLVHLFTFTRYKRPTGFSIKSIRPRSSNKRNKKRRRSSKSKLGGDDDDSVMIPRTISSSDDDTRMNTRLYTSPARRSSSSSTSKDDDDYNGDHVEDACRLFEKYLMDMIVQDGKVGDLTDVEDLLYSWTQLKSPHFIDLVSTFYGELCLDLFSPQEGA